VMCLTQALCRLTFLAMFVNTNVWFSMVAVLNMFYCVIIIDMIRLAFLHHLVLSLSLLLFVLVSVSLPTSLSLLFYHCCINSLT